MLNDIQRLRSAVAQRRDFPASVAISGTLTLLEREVRARLAFEDALRDYLADVGPSPFAAAARLREFLDTDLRSEA